jgi:hypothetical protein
LLRQLAEVVEQRVPAVAIAIADAYEGIVQQVEELVYGGVGHGARGWRLEVGILHGPSNI